ncbi:PAS domain S-box protein, partial [bacterium]|nr:PAS domain S-box protein [bacterium]
GYSQEEGSSPLPADVFQLIRPAQVNRLRSVLDSVQAEKRIEGALYRLRTATGAALHAEITATTIPVRARKAADVILEIRDVTEEVKTNQALQQSEQKYRLLAEAAQDFIFIIDRMDRVRYVNPTGLRHLGKPAEQVVGKKRSILFPPETSRRQKMALDRVFREGISLYSENPLTYAQSSAIWLGTWLVPLFNVKKQVHQVLGISRNITDRIHAAQQADKINQRYKDIIERSIDGYFFVSPQGKFLNCNPALEKILGYSRDEIMSEGLIMYRLSPKVLQDGHYIFTRALAGEPTSSAEITMPRKDGRLICVSFHFRRVMQDGRVLGVEGFTRDITEQKANLAALQASEARYRSLFDSIPYEAFSLTTDGTVQEANRLFTSNWGHGVGRLLPLVVEDAGVSGLYKNLIKKVLESKQPHHDIFSIMRQEEKVYYSTMISPILTSEGVLIGMVGMNINTTAQMINLARLRRLSMRLVEVQEDERTHIAREIHDSLGQYLTALQMEIGALTSACPEANERVTSLLNSAKSTINEAVRIGRTLVQTLRTPVLDDFGLEAAIKDYVEEFKNKWNIRIAFQSNNASNLLSREVETTLFRVLQEACLNVLKHAQTDFIEVRLKRMKNRVTLSVRDYGVGFEPVRPGLREMGHFGLLAMQERVELMNGRFRLISNPHSGTLIVILIPLQDKETA